eukprot:3617073-Pyramimonas_sp.AAC.1
MVKTRSARRRRPPSWGRGPRATTSAPAWTAAILSAVAEHAPRAEGPGLGALCPGALAEAAPCGI